MDFDSYMQLTAFGKAEVWSSLPLVLLYFLPYFLVNVAVLTRLRRKRKLAIGLALWAYAAYVPWYIASDHFFYGGHLLTQSSVLAVFFTMFVVWFRCTLEPGLNPAQQVGYSVLQIVPTLLVGGWIFI